MSSDGYQLFYNDKWEKESQVFFTVITPVFNRRKTLERTIDSVKNQTFTDYEYVIIDDGSSESSDDIVFEYMAKAKVPVLYVKKPNGGVHTARNVGYKHARGTLIVNIDSDDELLPDALKIFYKQWNLVPEENKEQYWQIKARCVDQNGNIVCSKFPDDINSMDKEQASKHFSMFNGEQLGCRVAKIMKQNLFPEPKGVKFVPESFHWLKLEREYRSWGTNEIVRIWHVDGDDHLSLAPNNKKISLQTCKNIMWASKYKIENSKLLVKSIKDYMVTLFKFCVFRNVIKTADKEFVVENKINKKGALFLVKILYLPSLLYARWYKKKRCVVF